MMIDDTYFLFTQDIIQDCVAQRKWANLGTRKNHLNYYNKEIIP